MISNPTPYAHDPIDNLDALLRSAHQHLGWAVGDRITAQGGAPELRDPDLALGRLLAAAHRATGAAVEQRLNRNANQAGARRSVSEAPFSQYRLLSGRRATTRLKYRREALDLAHTYWPRDLTLVMRAALSTVEKLSDFLDAGETPAGVGWFVERLAEQLAHVDVLPVPQDRPRAAQAGADYVMDVKTLLESHVEQFLRDVRNAQHLMQDELVPLLDPNDPDGPEIDCFVGADAVAQVLAEDLELAHDKAQALHRVVVAVERVSSDFVGEDLSQSKLDHVPLKGIRWDAATLWPEEWAALIRQASTPASGEQGVLIVATEPHDIAVAADV
ncbi:hypothetical protein [Streptomyces toxytricini]|uniref:hypothetical protein n=1 Tax=Streptomyces toxytricini TaxID=67369 RepID=UPI0034282EA1